jgi:hypothetical protein
MGFATTVWVGMICDSLMLAAPAFAVFVMGE